MAAKKNAIERRFDELTGLWNEFAANPKGRLLRWVADADNYRMAETFLDAQRQGGSEVPDLFLRFETAFENPQRYGFALIEELRRQFEESRDELAQQEIPAWDCPKSAAGESDVAYLARCCTALALCYDALLENLVLILLPAQIADRTAWARWLLGLVRTEMPPNVRALVLDMAEAPALESLAREEPERVVTVPLDLDMPGAYQELARDVKGTGPGFTFRRNYVALTNAAGKGDVAGAKQSAEAALGIAVQQNWPQMQVAVHMALGAALLGKSQFAEALTCYRNGSQSAKAAVEQGDPAGPKMLLPCRFAEGAALLSEGRHAEAAKVYEETAPLAASQSDPLMTLEAWRMAAYCHEAAKQPATAWECGQKALEVGAMLTPEQRETSLLPFVGQLLLRLTQQRPYRDQADPVRRRMTELLGPDWEKKLNVG